MRQYIITRNRKVFCSGWLVWIGRVKIELGWTDAATGDRIRPFIQIIYWPRGNGFPRCLFSTYNGN